MDGINPINNDLKIEFNLDVQLYFINRIRKHKKEKFLFINWDFDQTKHENNLQFTKNTIPL